MPIMAKKREASWAIFARIDPALQEPVQQYIASRDYPPQIGQVLERALKELLKREGFWPPKQSGEKRT